MHFGLDSEEKWELTSLTQHPSGCWAGHRLWGGQGLKHNSAAHSLPPPGRTQAAGPPRPWSSFPGPCHREAPQIPCCPTPCLPTGLGFPLSAVPTRAWESQLSRKISSFSIRKSLPLPPLPPLFLGLSTRAETLRSSERAMIEGRQAFQPAPWPPGTRLPHLPAGAASTWGILPPVPPDSASHSSPALAPPQPAKLGGTGQRHG